VAEKDAGLLQWLTQLPNAVKSTVLLMKMSFDLEKPSAKEAKTSLYKSLLEQKLSEESIRARRGSTAEK
jgi:hypothetical protein